MFKGKSLIPLHLLFAAARRIFGCLSTRGERLLLRARHWLYEHRLIIVHERAIRTLVAAALAELEATTAASIRTTAPPPTLKQWVAAVAASRPDGQHRQSWP